MKFSSLAYKWFALLLIVPLFSSCQISPAEDPGQGSESRIIQTIPPATLTAISEMAAASQTPVPAPMGIPWSELEGLHLEFWYIWDLDESGVGMHAIVERFNNENEWGITVNAVDQGLVLDPIATVEAAFADGLVPHLMLSDSSVIAGWYEKGLTIDLSYLLADPAAGMAREEQKAFYPGIWENFTLSGDDLPGIPFSQSIQVIYYNESWARELGYNSPPYSIEDLMEQSCTPVEEDQPAGMVFSPQAENILSFLYANDGVLYQPGADAYQFSSPEIKELARDWRAFFQDGCGTLIANYPNPMAIETEFESFNQRDALMIMGSSRMMEHVHTGPNQTGRADDWTMLPFMGPGGSKAVASDLQSVVIFKTSPPEELASWLFLKYLVSPEVQSEWAQYSYYYPTRKDSFWFLREFRKENPSWAEGLNLLKYSRSAPLHPSWNLVKLALEDAFEVILARPDLDPDEQLDYLNQIAAELWERSDR